MHRSVMMIRCCMAFVRPLKQFHHHHHLGLTKILTSSTGGSSYISQNVKHEQRLSFHRQQTTTHLFSSSSNVNNKHDNNNSLAPDLDQNKYQYKKTYKLSATGHDKSFVTIHTNTGHTIQTDIPKQMGGTDKAPQPVETLLAAWIGCTQATALFVARNMMTITTTTIAMGDTKEKPTKPRRIEIDRLEFENIVATRDERGALGGELPIVGTDVSQLPDIPSRLEKVQGVIRVYAKEQHRKRGGGDNDVGHDQKVILSQEELSILAIQTERRCPVGKSSITCMLVKYAHVHLCLCGKKAYKQFFEQNLDC